MPRILLALLPLALCASAENDHPLLKDHTGMAWVLPFKQAQKQAAETKRLLLIKPVAFGTSPDGGW